jgi:hypothetical protein
MSGRLSADELGALRALAHEAGGHATTGDGPADMHPSWKPALEALAQRGLVDSYPENGTLAGDPGRTFYEVNEAGAAALANAQRPGHYEY